VLAHGIALSETACASSSSPRSNIASSTGFPVGSKMTSTSTSPFQAL